MDRRSKTRVDVQLTCFATADRIEAIPLRVLTENVSRTGILMRWNADSPLPEVSRSMTLDVLLPENSDFGPRVMRCRATVIRITHQTGDHASVAFEVQNMRFIQPRSRRSRDLAAMPAASSRVV